MPPILSKNYVADGVMRNIELLTQRNKCSSMAPKLSNKNHIFGLQFGLRVALATSRCWKLCLGVFFTLGLATLGYLVSHVFNICSNKQMSRVAARRIITFMQAGKSMCDGSILNFPHHSVCPNLLSLCPKNAITTIKGIGKWPTFVWSSLFNFTEKSNCIFLSHNPKTTPRSESVVGSIESRSHYAKWKEFWSSILLSHNKAWITIVSSGVL